MAILTSVGGSDQQFYDIPEADLQQYAVQKEQLTDQNAAQALGGGKTTPTKEDAEGTMPSAMMGGSGDVQAYGSDICYVRQGRTVYWWYC